MPDRHQNALFRTQCLIGSSWSDAADGATFEVSNPSTGARLGTVPSLTAQQIAECIDVSQRAFGTFRQTAAAERAGILTRWASLMHAHCDDLAAILTSEQGKPFAEAQGEIRYAAGFLEWFAEEARRLYGDIIPSSSDQRLLVSREPVGVCGVITPWNFPAAMITRKVGAALAAGCTAIAKPAEDTPYTALALAALALEAGAPAGVFQVVTGDPAMIGKALCDDSRVRKISFTGSTQVGRILYRQCADTVKRISLELGGNAPFIVFDDADLDAAVAGAMASKFRNAGQTCVCANRIFVQNRVYAAFAKKLKAAVEALQVGDGFADGVEQGPLINPEAVEKVEAHISDALERGGHVLTGGQRHERGGHFFQPTILTDVSPEARLMREETFGPVAPLIRFEQEEEAITLANATESGLASYFYSRDLSRCFRVSAALEFGMVGVNTGSVSNPVAPFGGVKQSGIGREGSKYGADEYTELKYIAMGGIEPGRPSAL